MQSLTIYETSKWKNGDVKKAGRHIYLELKGKKYKAWDEYVVLAIVDLENWGFRNIEEWGWILITYQVSEYPFCKQL